MNIAIVALLLLAGVGLILVELFLIPGVSIAGICGLLSLGGSVYASYAFWGAMAGHFMLFLVLLIVAIGVYMIVKFRTLDRMSLSTNIDAKVNLINNKVQLGDEGVTISRLAPMGTVLINGESYECKYIGGFLEEGKKVRVSHIEGNILQVTHID